MENCIFCQIASHSAPCDLLYEDEKMIAIHDVHPLAPVHILIIPKEHIASLNEIQPDQEPLLASLLVKAREIAFQMGIGEGGYRIAINTGRQGGQTIFHLHVHLLGGEPLTPELLHRGLH